MIAGQTALSDFKLKPQADGEATFLDDERERLDRLAWESREFTTWMYDDKERMTLTRTSVSLKGARRIVGTGKKSKKQFFLIREHWVAKAGESIEDEIPVQDLGELERMVEHEREYTKALQEGIAEGLLFDGRRYWWKFTYEDGEVTFTERA